MTSVEAIPIAEQLACVHREVSIRRRTYKNRVHTGRMSARQADRELAAMEAVEQTLTQLQASERLL